MFLKYHIISLSVTGDGTGKWSSTDCLATNAYICKIKAGKFISNTLRFLTRFTSWKWCNQDLWSQALRAVQKPVSRNCQCELMNVPLNPSLFFYIFYWMSKNFWQFHGSGTRTITCCNNHIYGVKGLLGLEHCDWS